MAYQPGLGAPPQQVQRKRRGCLGCFIPLIIIVALIGGGIFLLTSAANAAVAVPAQLLVVTPTASLTHRGSTAIATSGTLIHEGDGVKTDAHGRAMVQFQDGSLTRIAPDSEITLDATKFAKNGSLQNVSITQVAGRTMSTVEHLVSGSTFHVGGHNASAEVRGTRWEFIVVKNGQTILKVYVGTVKLKDSSAKETDVAANKQIIVEVSGKVGAITDLVNEPNDPFNLWVAGEEAAAKNGSTAGSGVSSYSPAALVTGQSQPQPDYGSAGGDVVGDLLFPGSNMQLQITDPHGKVWAGDGGVVIPGAGRLVEVVIPNGPPGIYKVRVNALSVPAPGEDYSVTLTTRIDCKTGITDAGGAVRHVYSASDIVAAINQAGAGSSEVTFGKLSSGGASVGFKGTFSGMKVSAHGAVYAGGTGIGVTFTSATVNGIDVTSQVISSIASGAGKNLDNIDVGFLVDRVYTCSNGKDTAMVVEGHH